MSDERESRLEKLEALRARRGSIRIPRAATATHTAAEALAHFDALQGERRSRWLAG